MGRSLNEVIAALPAEEQAAIDARYQDLKQEVELVARDVGEIKGEPAPAAADIEDPLTFLDQQLGGEVTLLGKLGVVQRCIRRFKISAAILLVAIEE